MVMFAPRPTVKATPLFFQRQVRGQPYLDTIPQHKRIGVHTRGAYVVSNWRPVGFLVSLLHNDIVYSLYERATCGANSFEYFALDLETGVRIELPHSQRRLVVCSCTSTVCTCTDVLFNIPGREAAGPFLLKRA